jgi:NAD(P)-dependent dehydrogenase (short-subunit alcohol dehydrogenase family)
MKCNLSEKVSLVTGAAQGIGCAIAERLATNGSLVVYSDLDLSAVERAAQQRNDLDSGRGHLALRMDVTSAKEVSAAVEEIKRKFGRIDILVNNAGVNTLQHRVTIDQFPRAEWDRLINVDLNGVFEVSRAVVPLMREQKSGRIVNIASVMGLVAFRLQCAYIAAKAGVVHLTRAMALELAPDGILVNAVCPGSVLTEGTRKLFYGDDGKFHDKMQRMIEHIPLSRPAQVDEIAIGVLFLVDPENSYTTGHVLTIDGGWTCGFARDF